jgi:glycosyltransferase involved in cell wall biosynthesis
LRLFQTLISLMDFDMKNIPELSIVIPAYNEEARIGTTLQEYLKKFQDKFQDKFELVVVLNGCKDRTLEIIQSFQKEFPQLRYLNIPEAIGKGGALTEGFKSANGEIIGFTDADASTSADTFFNLYKVLINFPQIDAIIGSRNLPESIVKGRTKSRKIMTSGFNFGINFLFNLQIKDTQCGAKLIRKHPLKKIIPHLSIANMAFDVNLLVDLKRFGYKILEFPILWEDSQDSTIKNPARVAMTMALAIIRLRLIYSPLKKIYPLIDYLARPLYELLLKDKQKKTYENWKKSQTP